MLRAAGDALAEVGYGRLDLADVARRAGVGKTTLYRRWGSVPLLVADLLVEMADESSPRADTGSLREDLTANAELVRRTLTDPRQGPLFRALIAAGTVDEQAATALANFYEVRVAEWAPCVEDAITRGEVPAGTDAAEVVRAVSAPMYYRFLLAGLPLTKALATRAAEAAATAAAAGVFVQGVPDPSAAAVRSTRK